MHGCKKFLPTPNTHAPISTTCSHALILTFTRVIPGGDNRQDRVQRGALGGLRGASGVGHQEGRQVPEQGEKGRLL